MKVRIQGNSIRLRLKQEEVACLAQQKSVEARMAFGPDADSQHLVYRIDVADVEAMGVAYQAHCVTVILPQSLGQGWDTSSEVGFEDEVRLENGGIMHVLMEKDFKCLEVRADEGDCYPNPNVSC